MGFDAGFLTNVMLLSVASGTLALTLTYSHLTKSLRHEYMDAPYMIGELINCPYCMAHWTSLPIAIALGGNIGVMFVNWLIVTGLSAFFIGVMLKLFLFREGENEDLRETLREAREALRDLMEAKHE